LSLDARRSSRGPALLAGLGALLVAVGLGLAFGTEPVSVLRAARDATSLDRVIVVEARLPRVLLGVLAGGGLAATGVAFQGVLRNPLAEPFVLGVSGGASLGATIAILLGFTGLTALGASIVPLAAFAGGVVATVFVNALARGRGTTGTSVLLAGVIVNAISSAAITFLKTLATASKSQELLFWLMGFLDVPAPASLLFVTIYVALGTTVLLVDAGRLNLLALGDESAGHLGVDTRALERRTVLACSCVVGAIVSVTGLIGFIGLLVPHVLRRLFGPDLRVLLPASLLAGGATLVVCDLVGRLLFRWIHTEPPVGAVTALVGGPLFLLVLRNRP
jgi:iron complex transport system permease protein